MATLTHVRMWNAARWEKITAEEAAKLYPGTVSAHSGLFMCDLCGQYVTLTNGEKKVSYFKHSAYEKSKDCPERIGTSSLNSTYAAGNHELPIRLSNISESQFELEIGLLSVPLLLLHAQKIQEVNIHPIGNSTQSFVYSFERLNSKSITYVSIGGKPAPKYEITSSDELKKFWPQYVKGVDKDGSIFDSITRKKLTEDADVQVGKCYYLLISKKIYKQYQNIEIRQISQKNISWNYWYIYAVKATNYDEEAARFFLDLHCRLTAFPVFLQPVWPVYVETPYVFRHNQEHFLIHRQGDQSITTKTFPIASIRRFPCMNNGGELICINCNDPQQLVSVGRVKVLQYIYLWKEKLDDVTDVPEVKVTDVKNKILEPGIQSQLPEKKLISIVSLFDGTVIIKKNGAILEKRYLKANQNVDVDGLQFGFEIKIFQGLDLVWSVVYEQNHNIDSSCDAIVLKKLESFSGELIPIAHSIGAVVGQLNDYPKVKSWLYWQIRKGYMSKDAFHYFRRFMLKQKSR